MNKSKDKKEAVIILETSDYEFIDLFCKKYNLHEGYGHHKDLAIILNEYKLFSDDQFIKVKVKKKKIKYYDSYLVEGSKDYDLYMNGNL